MSYIKRYIEDIYYDYKCGMNIGELVQKYPYETEESIQTVIDIFEGDSE